MSVLCESLKTNTTLEKLDIESDGGDDVLGVSGAKLIAEMLKVNTPLNRLMLNSAELPIDELKTATFVNLSDKGLQPTDAIIIASLMSMVNTALTTLNICSNKLGVEGAKAIAGALPR